MPKLMSPRRIAPWLAIVILLTSCGRTGTSTPTPESSGPEPAPVTAEPTATATAEPTATATATPLPSATPTPSPLAPSTIFDQVSPSVVFVDTGVSTGSGLIIADGFVVTNAHVVWPHQQVRIVLTGGGEHERVPVARVDRMNDLALLGPLPESDLLPITFGDGEDLIIGSNVYLIGYPAEVDRFPDATITGGLISRIREWETAAITFFQTDAKITGGQSGGALVSEMGEVIGISGFSFDEAQFGLVASATDLVPHIEALLAEEGAAGVPRYEDGETEQSLHVSNGFDSAAYILDVTGKSEVTVEASAPQDLMLRIVDVNGQTVDEVDDGVTGSEHLSFSPTYEGPYFALVLPVADDTITGRLSSNVPAIPLRDRDDSRPLRVDKTVEGVIDHPGEVDLFTISLRPGEIVNFHVDSALIDPLLLITYPEAGPAQAVADDNSGEGLFGRDAELTYLAPHEGEYLVLVQDSWGTGSGGYTLSVSSRRPGAPTPVAPEPTPVPLETEAGLMNTFEEPRYGFSVQIPISWTNISMAAECTAAVCFEGSGGAFVLEIQDMATLELEETITPAQFRYGALQGVEQGLPVLQRSGQTQIVLEGGVPADVVTYQLGQGVYSRVLVAFENNIGIVAFYGVEDTPEARAMVDYSLSTITFPAE